MALEEGGAAEIPGVERVKQTVYDYGLGALFAANVFGAGSVYILADTGANFGYLLLWTMPLAFILDLGLHEMSGRLATIDKPLMEYIRDVVGPTLGKVFAVTISFIMSFWAISNYAIGGLALTWLSPLDNVYLGTIIVAAIGLALVELKVYDRIEAAITILILAVFGIYIVLAAGLDLSADAIAAGFVPAIIEDVGYLAAVIALIGTTVYYPNFFIQSSMRPSKGWTEMNPYRRDNLVGITIAITLSTAVIVVSAATLAEGEPTLTSPGEPLMAILGEWALVVFVFAVFLATFTSATGTLFGAGFMIPQAWGRKTVFGDVAFRRVVEGLIVLSVVCAVLILEFTNMTPVRLGIVMPAINGLIGIPLTALALYYANKKFFDHPLWMRVCFAAIVLFMFVTAALTAQDLYEQIIGWL
ncbi:MAG: divalent metal cation transporter [Euryarchaeota archaeon]|nr:divalent metal cation transporter [Euryarchaeota archaeon]